MSSSSFISFNVEKALHFKKFNLNLENRGLVRLTGPNGAGKSSVGHLLTQNIYGSSPNKLKKNDFVSDAKGLLSEFTFKKDDSLYVSAVAEKCKVLNPEGEEYGSGTFLFKDGKIATSHRDGDVKLITAEVLGWSAEEWYGYVYLAQSSTHTLLKGTRSVRQAYLSRLFNLSPLDTVHTHYGLVWETHDAKVKEADRLKDQFSVKASIKGDRVSTQFRDSATREQSHIEDIQHELTGLQAQQNIYDQVTQLEAELKQLDPPKVPIESIQTKLKGLQEQAAVYQQAQAVLDAHEKSLRGVPEVEIPVYPDDYEAALEAQDISEADTNQKILNLRRTRSSMPLVAPTEPAIPADYEEILATPDINAIALKSRISLIKQRAPAPDFERIDPATLSATRKKVSDFEAEIKTNQATLRRLEFNQDICDKCGTTLDCQDRSTKQAETQELIEGLQIHLNKAKKKLSVQETCDQEWRDYDAQGPDLSHEIPELQKSIDTYELKRKYRLIKIDKDSYDLYLTDAQQIAELPGLESARTQYLKKQQYRGLQQQIQTAENQAKERIRILAQIKEAKASIPTDPYGELETQKTLLAGFQAYAEVNDTITRLKSQGTPAKNCSAEIEQLKTKMQGHQKALGSLEQEAKEVETLERDLEKLQAEIETHRDAYVERDLSGALYKGYGKAGLMRQKALRKYSAYLEEALLPYTLRQFPQHRFKIEIDDGVDILASKNNGRWYDVATMSGGESALLGVSFLFALDDILPPAKRSQFKLVDEVEASLDPERRGEFVHFILPELRKRAKTVVVISHSEVSQEIQFDATWSVKPDTIVESCPDREYVAIEEEQHA